jgi:hypothetical protein
MLRGSGKTTKCLKELDFSENAILIVPSFLKKSTIRKTCGNDGYGFSKYPNRIISLEDLNRFGKEEKEHYYFIIDELELILKDDSEYVHNMNDIQIKFATTTSSYKEGLGEDLFKSEEYLCQILKSELNNLSKREKDYIKSLKSFKMINEL